MKNGDDIFRRLRRVDSPEPDAQLWMANLDFLGPNEIEKLSASLHVSEMTRAAKFHFQQDRQRYLAAHGLLRYLLGSALDQRASEIAFTRAAGGKPRLCQNGRQNGELHFNLSHSGEWGIFVLSWNRELGIDLESDAFLPVSEPELMQFAARILSVREFDLWSATEDPAGRRAAFLRAWTRKEAFVKATGEGLARELAKIELGLDTESLAAQRAFGVGSSDGITRRWVLYDLAVPAALAAALAVSEPDR